jgi:3',5'-nucleoside bisphosphate phosphatase
MKYAYDLHIHSVLSPCADVLMTPNNIFNMASLKGLDMISITDHNSLKQLTVCHELSKSYDMLFIPGVEITVKEDFDVLCYFKTLEDALVFDKILETHIQKQTFDSNVMGNQEIMNIHDEIVAEYPYLLINPINLGIKDLIEILKDFEHIIIYAHIDRSHRSGINYIKKYPLDGVEYKNIKNNKNQYKCLKNSDAHQIIDILEKKDNEGMMLDDLSIESFFRYFNK